MASTFTATSSIGSMVATKGHRSDNKLMNNLSSSSFGRRQNVFPRLRRSSPAIAGVNKLAYLVGVTLGPKGRNAVLESKHGSPRIVNDGVTVVREVELEDPVENIGAKLVRQAAAKTNDFAGDGTTTSVVLAQGFIAEGVKVVAAGANSVLITRGIEKTAKALVAELKKMLKTVSLQMWQLLVQVTMSRVGRKGVVTLEEGKSAENVLYVVEGMQFDRGYVSPYFVIDNEKMSVEFDNCKLLLVDKKITKARDLVGEKEKVNERIAKLSGGVVVIQVGAQTETELKEKKLRDEDALNATKVIFLLLRMSIIRQAAVEEGIFVGGGCTLLRLASKVDAIKVALDNDELKGTESWLYICIWKKLNQGLDGTLIDERFIKLLHECSHPLFCVFLNYIRCLKSCLLSLGQVLSNENVKFGYNAATGKYEDLMAAGIIDPTKLRLQRHSRCQTVLLLRSRNLSQFQQATQWTTQVCSDISLNLR
ncbi:unnamed protein product [Brassica napus]|uniref:(rape) hypothetical protein n=1 Tax=Brassica napus TaxID=3708 RepID=A0A816Q0J8_BRANA|nr:unnamed protein product [Brassica napus]